MGILGRLLARAQSRVETRASTSDSFAAAFGVVPTASGQMVNARVVENLSAVMACVGAISSAMASMNAYVYRRTQTGRVELPEHPVARLIRQPNRLQPWPDWIEFTLSQALLHGNSISVIEYAADGAPTALTPIPWGNVQVYQLPSGRLAYDVVQGNGHGGTGIPRRYLDGEVFHVRDRSEDGLVGRSRISRASEVLGSALALQEWSGAIWKNGATPSLVVPVPNGLSPEGKARMVAHWQREHVGAHNGRKIYFADQGMDVKPISVSPEDAEVLASRRFTVEELCRLFQVPPPIAGDLSHGTFTNSREAGRWFAQFTLAPWARKLEAEFARSVFGPSSADCSLEIDLSGLMRGDAEARWQSHKIAVEAGILEPDEVREIEGWNPRGKAAPAREPAA
jgi:HK97 family phage portal protein